MYMLLARLRMCAHNVIIQINTHLVIIIQVLYHGFNPMASVIHWIFLKLICAQEKQIRKSGASLVDTIYLIP